MFWKPGEKVINLADEFALLSASCVFNRMQIRSTMHNV